MGWSQRDTRGTSSTGQADNTETSEETKDKFLNITPDELWKVQEIQSSKRGRLSQTYKESSEANVKVCDLKQKTTQALDTLAVLYATFEKASANSEVENSERNMLCADVPAAMEEFNEAQQNQERMRGELKDSRESLDIAIMDMQESMSKLKKTVGILMMQRTEA